MDYSIFFTGNSQEVLDELESHGFYICPCCKFNDVKWIHFYRRTINVDVPKNEFHGTGDGCDECCDDANTNKCTMCALERCAKDNRVIVFSDINEMIEFINKHYKSE